MIIIQMAGGLGNQMFQYALYKQFQSMGKTVKMDDEAGFKEDAKRSPSLASFGITYERASVEEIRKMTDSSPTLSAKVRRKLFGRQKKSYFEESKRFLPQIFTWDDIYLEGYWQSEKYFADVKEQIKQEYHIENIRQKMGEGFGLSKEAEALLQQIEQTKSVSIHVRRGDYLLPENQELFGNICTASYYRNAMTEIIKQEPDSVFYLFTNDKTGIRDWIAEVVAAEAIGAESAETDNENRIKSERIIIVDLPEERDYEELLLMSRCKHNILANSSFSWWASYLNPNPEKQVLVPTQWLNGWDCQDIYRADMQKIGKEMQH